VPAPNIVDRAQLLTLSAPEMTVLVGGLIGSFRVCQKFCVSDVI
jgi:catalase (peroxidase I)